jgi:hypothetical protein
LTTTLHPEERHEGIRAVSRQLTHLLGGRAREGSTLRRLDSLGSRLSALVTAVAVQAPYLATSHHHAGSRVGLDEIQAAFFDDHEEEHELRALVFTDTLDETNGVAGTMRRLAAEGERGALPVRVAPRARSTVRRRNPPCADWTLPLPTTRRLGALSPMPTCSAHRGGAPDVVRRMTCGRRLGLVAAPARHPLVGSYHELGPYALHLTKDMLVAGGGHLGRLVHRCAIVLAPTLRCRRSRGACARRRRVRASTVSYAQRRTPRLTRTGSCAVDGSSSCRVRRVGGEAAGGADRRSRVSTRPDVRLAIVGDGRARVARATAPEASVLGDYAVTRRGLREPMSSAPRATDTFRQVLLQSAASGTPAVAVTAGDALVAHPRLASIVADDPALAMLGRLASAA